ncbi:tetratricopeptide repeat protein [Luteithermobacter gelatinilyticus]|uniref:tetratricopeptide repeat protein n=1 Tax=Luteithermobacter gelatinilyticus TaxID=2582913 RepID=UPI001106AC66|nr:hypothetical protein [Luteithermobacter gelatinilyticus]
MSAASPLSPEQVKDQLDRILNSRLFENKNRPKRFLTYVVEETLKGRAELLKGYTLGIEVFDKDEDFDPQTDAIVRVEAGRLRRLLEHYYLEEGTHDPIHISLPKGTYIPEIEKRAPAGVSPARDPLISAAAAPPTGPAIAVLPFDNLSGDQETDLFCDGISEEIITQLSLSPTLYVVSRKSTLRYKGQPVDIRKLCEELEVHYVLEGSIRRAGSTVRVTAQLLDATNDAVVWANSYDRQLTPDNLISVQDEIATQVAATIGDTYGAIMRTSAVAMKRSSTEYLEAYESMLLLHDYLFELSPETHLKARQSLEKAIEIDPNYPDAWAGMAYMALDEYRFSFNVQHDKGDPLERARQYAEKAIGMSSTYSIAWYALTIIHYHAWELDKFENNVRMGLSIAPNSPALLADSGVYLCLCGEMEKGLSLVQKAMALNPQHPGWCRFALFHNHFVQGEYEEAMDHVRVVDMPDWFWPHALQAINYAMLDKPQESERAADNVLRLYPEFPDKAELECRKWFRREEDLQKYLVGLKKAGLLR